MGRGAQPREGTWQHLWVGGWEGGGFKAISLPRSHCAAPRCQCLAGSTGCLILPVDVARLGTSSVCWRIVAMGRMSPALSLLPWGHAWDPVAWL